MKKIIHMSDLHVGYQDLGKRLGVIVRNLICEKGDKASDYVIVVTGDLVDNANQSLYDEVNNHFATLKVNGFKNILVVPGNHDYREDNVENKQYVEVFKATFFNNKKIKYPKLDIIPEPAGKNSIAFIGLDSMAEELHWYDSLFAEGELGKGKGEQLERLDKMLQSAEVKKCGARVVYLHHHPFDAFPMHQLKDSEALCKLLANSINKGVQIDALLYGHNHLGKTHNGGFLKIPRCYDAGTATLKDRTSMLDWMPWFKVRSAIRCIDLSRDARLDYIMDLL